MYEDDSKFIGLCKKRGLERVDLSTTKEGYPIYEKLGFTTRESWYCNMRYMYED